jgi:chaperonin cofactor prefoldin
MFYNYYIHQAAQFIIEGLRLFIFTRRKFMNERHDWLTYVNLIVLVIVIVAFSVLYYQMSSHITNNDSAITTLQNQTTTLQSQLSSTNSQISSLGGEISTLTNDLTNDGTQISSLNSQLGSANSQITALSQQLDDANTKIGTLQADDSSSSSQIATLQSQQSSLLNTINSLQSQLTSTQGTVNSLQSEINEEQSTINTLTSEINTPVTLFSSQGISQGPNTTTLVYEFTPAYTGYISVSGISSSATGYILIVNNDAGTSSTYAFGTGTTIYVQLVNSDDYSIYFGNRDTSGIITATLSGTYQL